MNYTFDILGVSPILRFFDHQQAQPAPGVEYFGSYHCCLDVLLDSVSEVAPKHGWDLDSTVDTVIQFWMSHAETIQYWKRRLEDAGADALLVSRLAHLEGLQAEFEALLR